MTNVVPASIYLSHFEKHSETVSLWRPFGAPKGCVKEEDKRINEAFRCGVAEGKAAALLECQAQNSAERRAAEEAHARDRALWVQEEGLRITKQLAEGLTLIENRISSLVAKVIEPFVEEQLLQKAKVDLVQKVRELLGDSSSCTVSVRGPEDFCEYLRSVLPSTVSVQFEPGSPELVIVIGETVIESRIAAWIDDLKKACK